jgi:DNA polymerase-3 subunit gamma/tau
MSLYLKYRPYDLSQVKGNADVISSLEGLLHFSKVKDCPHTFLLHGQTGCGKTTVGRIIANMLGCVGEDFVEINSASFRGIDTVREIINNSQFMPIEGLCRVWLIDECHKLTNDAQNALLKILEDTPSHVYFILCTTEPQKLIATIKGRCVQFQLLPLNETELKQLLRRVAHKEGEELEDNVLDQIVGSSKGFPRNALQILEVVLSATLENRLETAKKAEAEVIQSIELCRALAKKAPWKEIAKILEGLKDQEPEGIRRAVLGYCQAVLLKGSDQPLFGLIMEEFMNTTYDNGFIQITYACYSICKA